MGGGLIVADFNTIVAENLAKVSKLIIGKINIKLIFELRFNQWKNIDSVLKWFINKDPQKDSFIVHNGLLILILVKKFYSSINKDILTNPIQNFAKLYTTIDDKSLRLTCTVENPSCFTLGDETWKKKSTENNFDVIMGSFNDAGICELVGYYIETFTVKSRKYTCYNQL